MAWNNISQYLEKFFVISPPKKFYQKEIIKALNEILGIELEDDDIDCRFRVVYIKNNSLFLKNEIFLNKESIIEKTNQKLKNNKITDIRF